ncbi:unnamed protein product [Trichogramma brassicae]|uniref:Uncharacterized protein n=1 Tax=Trichogramma brassicae TaxID=86971 RepID=A0A6H5J019_9HYME|nr:unnamed protein product [Trichogramma brassicae]
MSRLRGPRANSPNSPTLVHRIVAAFFPRVPDKPALPPPLQAGAIVPAVTMEELQGACRRIPVPNAAIKIAIATHPDIFLQVHTACLRTGIFHACWKRQRLVLRPKPGKPPEEPSSYRPLCMLDKAGKILERIICVRLEATTERPLRSPVRFSEGAIDDQRHQELPEKPSRARDETAALRSCGSTNISESSAKRQQEWLEPSRRSCPTSVGPEVADACSMPKIVDSILLYGATIWSCATETQAYIRQAESVHRRAFLRVVSGRPHVSYDATYVIAGVPPLALLADERARIYQRRPEDVKEEERRETLNRWQDRWDRAQKGRSTHRLIPNITEWVERGHGEVDYHLTQLLTGHGYFKSHSSAMTKPLAHSARPAQSQ